MSTACSNCGGPDAGIVRFDPDLPALELCDWCALLLIIDPETFNEIGGRPSRSTRVKGLRAVAKHLGVKYESARKYASKDRAFPAPRVPAKPGVQAEWDAADLDAWREQHPNRTPAPSTPGWKTRRGADTARESA